MMTKVKVGVIGCGKISDQYFKGCQAYENLEVKACADLDLARAQAKAAEYGLAYGGAVEAVLADPEIEIVINLTVPQAHVEVNERILHAGKHAYVEKPFALDAAEGQRVLDLARSRKLLVGCAPDTFLGGGLQTALQLVRAGAIGRPVSVMGFMLGRGPESWHPSPEFYYQKGGGPMFDMGPYYLTAMVALLGPVARVRGLARTTFAERTITSQPLAGKVMKVEVPTHYYALLEFAGGAVGSLTTSFDSHGYPFPRIVLFGEESTLEVPDPNSFRGPVRLRSRDGKTYEEQALTHSENRGRGSGVADLAYALRSGRPHRVSGELANHVVEVMQASERASFEERVVDITRRPPAPEPLPPGLPDHQLDP